MQTIPTEMGNIGAYVMSLVMLIIRRCTSMFKIFISGSTNSNCAHKQETIYKNIILLLFSSSATNFCFVSKPLKFVICCYFRFLLINSNFLLVLVCLLRIKVYSFPFKALTWTNIINLCLNTLNFVSNILNKLLLV